MRRAFRADGDVIVLLGETRDELGGSEYLKVMHGSIRGVPPALDLDARGGAAPRAGRRRVGRRDPIRAGLRRGRLRRHAGRVLHRHGPGRRVDVPAALVDVAGFGDIATLFGESASRVVVSVAPAARPNCWRWRRAAGVPARRIGAVGGNRVQIAIDGRHVIDEPLETSSGHVGDGDRALLRARASYCVKPY